MLILFCRAESVRSEWIFRATIAVVFLLVGCFVSYMVLNKKHQNLPVMTLMQVEKKEIIDRVHLDHLNHFLRYDYV